ncbi:cysteine hydrolase family protein [Brevibacillus dissolubilis]|uniref:cysteine hydrolase family protein n=1 Tax=Brevibacillus dissolubilis TaxID=1844116 RepID=UPI0011179E15|nr:isochorismatase family cysteine hydrolase [Brevibacillus dissolubilis]
MKIGLLVIDMQQIFLDGQKEALHVAEACEYINYVADLLRSKDHLVIHIQDTEGADETNADLLAFIPEIKVAPQDICMTKEYSNAFWKTELEQILTSNGVGLVMIAGFAAEHCVLFTYNGAIERGFTTVILQNGILSTKSDAITQTYRDRNLISHPVIKYLVT